MSDTSQAETSQSETSPSETAQSETPHSQTSPFDKSQADTPLSDTSQAASSNSATAHSGGCQCGAVRFHVEGTLGDPSICHCRMCQKAFGGFYAPLVSTRGAKLTWTRGAPDYFQSSNIVKRGFCARCGTSLTYEAPDGIALAIGAFDHPETLAPVIQFGVEGKLPYVDRLSALANRHTMDDIEAAPFLDQIVSYQHPDHDTDVWPPK